MHDVASAPSASVTPDAHSPLMTVTLADLNVRYATAAVVEWLDVPAERLLGRSLIFSIPPLGQSLALALSGGLGAVPTPLSVELARTTDGARLTVLAHRIAGDAILELKPTDDPQRQEWTEPLTSQPIASATNDRITDHLGLRRRMDEMCQDLAALRTRLTGEARRLHDDPLPLWLWQAETALTQLSQRFADLNVSTTRKTASANA